MRATMSMGSTRNNKQPTYNFNQCATRQLMSCSKQYATRMRNATSSKTKNKGGRQRTTKQIEATEGNDRRSMPDMPRATFPDNVTRFAAHCELWHASQPLARATYNNERCSNSIETVLSCCTLCEARYVRPKLKICSLMYS